MKTNVKKLPSGTPNKMRGCIEISGTRYRASQSKPTLSTTENKPRVTILIGSVSSLSTGLTIKLIKVKTMANTTRATQSLYETLGRNQARITIANRVLINGRSTNGNHSKYLAKGQVTEYLCCFCMRGKV